MGLFENIPGELLAYVWMAIDSGSNVLVCGDPAMGKEPILVEFSAFVPAWKKSLAVNISRNQLKQYKNAYNLLLNPKDFKKEYKNILNLKIETMIISKVGKEHLSSILSLSEFGISFLASVDLEKNYIPLVSTLLAKPISMPMNTLSLLDIAIFVKQNTDRSVKILSILEYMWLNRAELDQNEIKNDAMQFNTLRIARNNLLFKEKLNRSKVIEKYSRVNILSRSQTMAELNKRVEILKSHDLKNPSQLSLLPVLAQ